MISSLSEVIERGINQKLINDCIDGECSGCGDCCTAILPVSKKELKRIVLYVKENGIKLVDHCAGLPMNELPKDMQCPFLDLSRPDRKCNIYDVRPKICRLFKCNQSMDVVIANREYMRKKNKPVHIGQAVMEELKR